MSRRRVAVLASGRGSNMTALLEAAARPGFPAEIGLVLSNQPGAAALGRARAAGVPALCLDHRAFGQTAPPTSGRSTPCWRNTGSNSCAWPATCGC